MAQTIKLRRSSTEGKVPTTAQLALGELAINTYDGRVFFEKNDGSASIRHIVTTDSITTGSIRLGDDGGGGSTNGSRVELGSGTGSLQILGDSANDNFFIYNHKALISGQSQTLYINAPTINIGGADPDTTVSATNVQISPTNLKFTNLSNQASEATALMINGSNVVGTRELGSNAFNSTSFLTSTGSVDYSDLTSVPAGILSSSAITITTAAQPNITSLGTLTTLTVDDITINGSTISDGGDFTIEANGDITLDANGADITLSDNGTNWGRFTRASSDFVIKSLSNNNDILFKGVDNSATITALQLDMSDAGTAIFNNNIKVVGNISGSSFNGTGLISGSSQVSHDSTTGFVANEHIDHSSVSITAGTGLNGGGTIASTRTLNVDDDYKNTSLNTFTSSFSAFGLTLIDDANASTARSTLGVDEAGTDNSTNVTLDDSSHNYLSLSGQEITIGQIDISDDTNLAVSDTSEVNMILSGDTLSAELIGGVVSGSSQITNIANSQLAGSIANSKLANSSISIGGISFSLGDTDATPAFDLQDATGYATSNLSGTITNSQLAGSIANGKLANSAITISGTSVSLGGSISDETLFGGTGVVSGSSQVVTAATVKGALNGNLGTLTLGDSNDTVSIPGNLSVEGTRTFIDSTTLQIGDNIIELNGSGTNDGGIYVRDAEASTTTTGSLIWNTGDDKWTAGPKGSEDDVVLATATQTLTNKTINGSQLVDDSVTNAKLDNSSVSFGGVSVALGSSDSTPAFNLADATGYQTSNLSGTITNSQLAGSIANGKLANSAITIMGTSTSLGGSFTTSDVVSALANTAVSNESLNSATGSYLTAHPNISAGSNISQDNSNGTVIQDLTITLDSNGHVTTATAGTVNLDGRYYTETESDTLYTKKLGQGVVSGSAQIDGASITNKSVSFGGVSVNLGSSDSTPAFNLSDATDYPTSELVGTITNSQLAGSIANGKLANSSVSFGGVSVSLGGSDSTPAFDLSDATGYATSNLSGTITNSQLAGSIANGKLSNSAITISGTSVSLGSSISDETLFGGTGVISGSAQVAHDSTNGFVANEHIDHSGVSISAGDGLTGGGTIQSTRTLAVDYGTSSDNVVNAADSGTPAGTSTILFAESGGVNKVALSSLNISLLNNNSGFGTGSVTNVTVGTGLDVSTGTTAPNITLDLSELTDMTADVVGSADELILLDNGAERRKQINEIKLSQFNNDSGFTSNTGDITGVTAGDGLTGGGSSGGVTLNVGVGTGLDVDSDQIDLDLSALPDMTQSWTNGSDEFIVLDGGVQKRKLSSEIFGSNAFTSTTIPTNNNQLTNGAGYITSFDITTQTDSKYLRSNATDTASGVITFSNSTSSTSKTTGAVIVTGGVGISGALNVGGDVTAFASSDERFKDLITPIENPNEKIKLLSGNTFVWNDKHEIYKGKKDIGVIAQEVEKVLPEIVETREDGYKAVKYEKIVALLIESNKELIKRVEELESKIK